MMAKTLVADNLYKAEIIKEALFFSSSGFIINPLFFILENIIALNKMKWDVESYHTSFR